MILKTEFKVELANGKDTAILTFAQPKSNDYLLRESDIDKIEDVSKKIEARFEHTLSYLIKVEGLKKQDGSEAGVADLKEYGMRLGFLYQRAINNAFLSAFGYVEETPEKKA